MTEYRILVTGSRDWTNKDAVHAALNVEISRAVDAFLVPVIVHGDCPTGADRIAAEFAEKYDIAVEAYPADWEKHGRAAGPIRNNEMVDRTAAVCLAFPKPNSRGTKHCMESAAKAGILVVDLSITLS